MQKIQAIVLALCAPLAFAAPLGCSNGDDTSRRTAGQNGNETPEEPAAEGEEPNEGEEPGEGPTDDAGAGEDAGPAQDTGNGGATDAGPPPGPGTW